ncbi:uncharacterized protein [Diadema antillarum]|uniref:uncharacterized protein n=1 Tax=Diadema antillarum TaxID=105358 RepID=UPI003A854570
MPEVQRSRSALVVVMEKAAGIFEVLTKAGVSVADHLVAVQSLPGANFDVTFKEEEYKEKFVRVLQQDQRAVKTAYSGSIKIVTVLHVPFEVDDNQVRFILSRYGKVLAGRHLQHREHPGLFNGTRQYRIDLKTDIPSTLSLGGRECWIRYEGQPRTCLKCGSTGHEAREQCRVVRCFRCRKEGHVASACRETITCTVCLEAGHSFRSCPVSFAEKLSRTKEWVSGGGVAVPAQATTAEQPVDKEPQREPPAQTKKWKRRVRDTSISDTDSQTEDSGSDMFDNNTPYPCSDWAQSRYASDTDSERLVVDETPGDSPMQVSRDEPFNVVRRRGKKRPPSPPRRPPKIRTDCS